MVITLRVRVGIEEQVTLKRISITVLIMPILVFEYYFPQNTLNDDSLNAKSL